MESGDNRYQRNDIGFVYTTAILVDGGYYRKRALELWGKMSAEAAAERLEAYCWKHINESNEEPRRLYRIFYYDCPPSDATVKNEFTGAVVRLKERSMFKRSMFKWNHLLLDTLKTKRKFALRLGELSGTPRFDIPGQVLHELLQGHKTVKQLKEQDFVLTGLSQKQVDMKIGMDIATLAYQHLVDQIILIAGDSDFVPVLKLARTAGIDVILDPMATSSASRRWVKPEMLEHVDGIETYVNTLTS